jgi:hypothetical protein
LQDQTGRGPFAPDRGHTQKIGAPLQAADGRTFWALILAHQA